MRQKIQVGYFCLLLLVCCLGCNNSNQNSEKVTAPIETTAPEQPTVHEVAIVAMKFQPDTVVVNKGDTIVFKNNDLVAHDVTDFPNKKWASPTLQAGDSWTYIATKNVNYFCSIHQVMKGKIIVK
ncbi:MAG TPA: plastocyanin/azurin family copper-binding protein [Arachidicoccus sp.]|nr:plastocyanin/azurin family copper-binding protein [Arachidicoccus sp.]